MKNKKLFLKISVIVISILILAILILAFLGKKERVGYLSEFKINVDKTLELNGLNLNKIKEEFNGIDNNLGEVAITNYIFTNSSITNYSYDFRIKYYSKIFRNSDIYRVYPIIYSLENKYISNITMNDTLGTPFGSLISTEKLDYDNKIDIKYYLLIKNEVFYYFIMIFIITTFFIFIHLLGKYLEYKKQLDSKTYSFVNKIEFISILFFIFQIWLFYPGCYDDHDTLNGIIKILYNISDNWHPLLFELSMGFINSIGLTMGSLFIVNMFLWHIGLFLIIFGLYIRFKNKLVLFLYLINFIFNVFLGNIIYVKDFIASIYMWFSCSIIFFIIIVPIKNNYLRNTLKCISIISLVIGMLFRHNFIVTVYPMFIWFTYDFLKSKNIIGLKKYLFRFISIMLINAIILMSIFYIFPRLNIKNSVTGQIHQLLFMQLVGVAINSNDQYLIPEYLYSSGNNFESIKKIYSELGEWVYLDLWFYNNNLKDDVKSMLKTLFIGIVKYPLVYCKFMYNFTINMITSKLYIATSTQNVVRKDFILDGYMTQLWQIDTWSYFKVIKDRTLINDFINNNRGIKFSKMSNKIYNLLYDYILIKINVFYFVLLGIILFFITGILWLLKFRDDMLLLSFITSFSVVATTILVSFFSPTTLYRYIHPCLVISIISIISFVIFIYNINGVTNIIKKLKN